MAVSIKDLGRSSRLSAARGLRSARSLIGRPLRPVFGALGRVFHLLTLRMPVPSETKWHKMVDCNAIMAKSIFVELRATVGEDFANYMLAAILRSTAETWVRAETASREEHFKDPGNMPEVVGQVFKSMDITSKIEAQDDGRVLRITNLSCPYLEWGKRNGVHGERVCDAVCGGKTSFFKGVSYGMPYHVQYQPGKMMGYGDPECSKTFRSVVFDEPRSTTGPS